MKLVDGTADSATRVASGGGVEANALRVTLASDSTGLVSVDDNGGSLTVDNAALAVVGGGVEATALRVTVASDSTGVLSVDDNGGSLTVDGTVTANAGTGDFLSVAAHTRNEAFKEANAVGGELDDTTPVAATEGNVSPVRITAQRAFHSNLRNDAGTEIATATNPVRVDPTGTTTQPVSGTVTANLAAGANNIGDVDVLSGPTGASALQVQGTAALGAAVVGNPVRIGGKDGSGNTRDIATDTSGVLAVGVNNTGADASANTIELRPVASGGAQGQVAVRPYVFNGTTWDRQRGTTTGTQVIGGLAHDAVNTAANSPQVNGFEAIAHGTNPTAVAAADVTKGYANRAGVPFFIGGHPNIQTLRATYATAQTDVALVTVGAGAKVVVTRVLITASNANSVNPSVIIGFGAVNTPTTTGVVAAHDGVSPGGGLNTGDGSGILGVGADGEDLRITSTTTGTISVVISYFTVES